MIRPRSVVIGALGSFVLGPAPTIAAEVSFKERFEAAQNQDVIVISAQAGDVLAIESGNYFTNGRRMVISADRAMVSGEALFAFFSPEDVPSVVGGVAATGPSGPAGDNVNCSRSGCRGKDGEPGTAGAEGTLGALASTMLLDIGDLVAPGRLTIGAAGQRGGKGQTGGKGGTGGRGGDGAKRSCGGLAGLDTRAGPGDGGAGGTGGPGGVGGRGGQGGNGGEIVLNAKLAAAWANEVLVVDLRGGAGGEGGDPGDKGNKGSGGGMGRGSSCGGGGHGGPDGQPGPMGEVGSEGSEGKQGSLQFSTLEVGAAPGPLPPGTETEEFILTQSEPSSDNCDSSRVVFSQTARVSDDKVIVKVLGSSVNGLSGVQGFSRAVVANLTADDPHLITAEGELRRHRTARLRFRNYVPNLRPQCPGMRADIKVSVLTTPSDSILGKALVVQRAPEPMAE